MRTYTPYSSVKDLPGVGATRQKQLEKLGIFTFKDLIYLFPRAYENRANVLPLSSISIDFPASVILTVGTEVRNNLIRKGLTVSKFRAFDDSGVCEVVFFNSPYVKDVFSVGDTFRIYGKATLQKGKIQFTNPKYEPYIEGVPLPPLVPVYPLPEGISSKFIDKITRFAIDEVLGQIKDPLPDSVMVENGLCSLSYALRNVHFPESEEALKKALRRLAFDEMLVFGIGISISSRYKTFSRGYKFSPCDLTPVLSLLPYELTGAQKSAVNDIYRDTVIPRENGEVGAMARILVGDVGSGKTICAILALYIAARSGYQAAFMAPTEILARQHYKDICALFDKLGIKCEILLGATSQKEKKRIYSSLESGECSVAVGTHALISDKVSFKNLGLIITDEQHRFGVGQRAVLKDRSKMAHLLVMSATPIPRTLALTMYGDLDVSRINEMPRGRMRVDTFVVDEGYRDRLNTFILRQVENGGQCYVVCPSIESESEDEGKLLLEDFNFWKDSSDKSQKLKNVIDYTEKLRQNIPNVRIELLHGRMKGAEKDDIMRRFSTGEIDVLVSTTVIEVGVNVPNASLMVVENAERFGLSQLHQLRGRVGRGNKKSYCVLVSDLNSQKAKSRLEIMRTTYDGYEIAEKDLIMRGPGDFFANAGSDALRQSGGFEFKTARLCDDGDLLSSAFSVAKGIVSKDPMLESEENSELRKIMEGYSLPHSSTIS